MSFFEQPYIEDSLQERNVVDPEKAAVVAILGRLVRDRSASWVALNDGDIELSLPTGEVFHLGEATVRRIA